MRFIDSPAKLTRYLVVAAIVLLASYAMAGTITPFTGSDDGAPTTGPFPMSAAAQTAFLAAAGPTTTSNFQSLAVGVYTPFTLATGVTVNWNAPNFGNGFSGISNFTFGNLDGFCVTPGCTQWFGSPGGTATYSFAKPVTAFGLWLTGVQTVFTSTFTLTFNDGVAETLNLPINVNGGTTFYGFTDSASFSSITITNLSNDAWGQDLISYSTQSSTVPEPSSLLLLGSGALGLAGMIRRKMML
jgi:PEP-CTERM motif